MSTENGETGEADKAISSAFCQFGQEEAFGGRRSRASTKKKQKKGAEDKMLTKEEFRMEVADTLDAIEEQLRQQWLEAACLARAAELQNFLLQQLVVALEGNGTPHGKLPGVRGTPSTSASAPTSASRSWFAP